MRKLLPSLVLGSGIIAYLTACGSDSTSPKPNGGCTGSSFTVAPMTGRVIPEADLACLSIPADGGTYLVVPQFVTATSPVNPVDFTLSAGAPGAAVGNIISASRQALPPVAGADLSGSNRAGTVTAGVTFGQGG